MLVQFKVKNYRSFKDEHTISFLASSDSSLLEENTFAVNAKMRLLKTTVIYGANASGKTSLFHALHFFLSFAVSSGPKMQIGDSIPTHPFAFAKETLGQPSSFELVFYLKTKDSTLIRYRYGLLLDGSHILEEYLYAINNVREVMLFDRTEQSIDCSSLYFKEGNKVTRDTVRANASFLSVCAQTNGEIAGRIVSYFRQVEFFSGEEEWPPITKAMKPDESMHKRIIDFLHFADLQIDDYQRRELPLDFDIIPDPDLREFFKLKVPEGNAMKLFFGHAMYEGDRKVGLQYLPEEDESTGTNKLFAYAGAILDVLEKGRTLFIDEFDSSLHPLIVENLIKLFNSPIENPNNAQLVVSCQSVHIMTNRIFRRDQIWFCEKNRYGASDLYSLLDFDEHVRKDASFNKNYLDGKYGAIPAIDEIILQMGGKN